MATQIIHRGSAMESKPLPQSSLSDKLSLLLLWHSLKQFQVHTHPKSDLFTYWPAISYTKVSGPVVHCQSEA